MGAESSKGQKGRIDKDDRNDETLRDRRIVVAFESLANGSDSINCKHFTNRFGEDLGSDLWKYLSNVASEKCDMDVELFAQKILSLIDGTSDCYIEVLSTADQIIRLCANNAGIFDLDAQFMDIITEDMVKRGTSCESLIAWKNENCARLCSALQMHVLRQFNLITHLPPPPDYTFSHILSPLQVWFIQCSLPDIYFHHSQTQQHEVSSDNKQCWTSLYTSSEHGISVTRFETNVFDYRGPTVSIFHLQDGQIFVLAVDQEWRHSGSRFGSVDSVLIEVQPKFKRIQKSSSVYCNLKLRNYPMKLSFDANEMSIDKEMSEVIAVEVFGCSSEKTLQEQHKQKDWQRKQVEKNKRVPLAGRWDDNPDKFILELGGVYSTADRREVFRRDD